MRRGDRRCARRGASLCAALGVLLAATPAAAQQPSSPPDRPWFVDVSHWGRWVALAGAGSLIGIAAVRHTQAGDARDLLEAHCIADYDRCRLVSDPAGQARVYADPEAERLYQDYAALEGHARGYLIGGQLTLLAASGMFLIDLLYRTDQPKNIPYTPLEVYSTPHRLGLALRF